MYHGMKYICPDNEGGIITTYTYIAIIQMQGLPEGRNSGKRIRSKTDTEPPLFQQAVVFIKRTTATKVEQHIVILHPYIHADITTPAGHRL